MTRRKKFRELRLYLNTLKFVPYKDFETTHNTTSILKEVFSYLRAERRNGNGLLIDRHENQDKAEPRELYMVTHRILPKERRIRCSMALLRKGKQPKLKPTDKFKLLPLSSLDGDIVEETHFFIDFSGSTCIICAEYNHNGPRLKDLEFYLRNIAGPNNLKLSKATEITILYNSTLDQTLARLQNVLSMDIKLKPSNLAKMDVDVKKTYYSSMGNIASQFKPKFLRLKTYFQIPGSSAPIDINYEANDWFRGMLRVFKSKARNIKYFENFEVRYEDIHGDENIFNLSKTREEIVIKIGALQDFSNKEMYTLIDPELNIFIASYYADA
ncbi:hypothetical protein [Arenibacter sp. ARW7G5Y1]|uniref:hypothetical protein n=1 Tax=Arenibacter sp. ARW7G5Y1 TaxID=2135619 RepID=UPI000D7510AD|nr:hypothetical protein [Arenibacter sp. ARW7G5Y1]PXX23733.1 hypothetical protein C7972_11826 [Arenibacter sp. ARW7G5Y1]